MAGKLSPFCRKLRESPAYGALVEALGSPILGYTAARWTSNPFGYPDIKVTAEMCEIWCTPRVVATYLHSHDHSESSPQFADLETVLVWLKAEGWI